MKYKVPFIKPNFPNAQDVAKDYTAILQANWYTNFGPFERKFAAAIGEYVGDGYHVATFSSATSALIASVVAILGRGDGSKYIVMPAFTFAAGPDTALWCGYKPVFVDIEMQGLHMDVAKAEDLLNAEMYRGKIAALLFCNAFGVGSTDIDAWEALAEKVDVPLIIDSAAGFGSLYSEGRKVGSAGVCEIFSFHATKPFAIGEGGAVVSEDARLIENLLSIQNFGFDREKKVVQLGFNGKLQEINAAIGLRQMETFSDILRARQAVHHRYANELNSNNFRLQKNAENASLCFAAVLVTNGRRDECLQALRQNGVDAKTYYAPSLHKQPFFKDEATFGNLETTERVDEAVLSLPIHDHMADADIELIINTLNKAAEA